MSDTVSIVIATPSWQNVRSALTSLATQDRNGVTDIIIAAYESQGSTSTEITVAPSTSVRHVHGSRRPVALNMALAIARGIAACIIDGTAMLSPTWLTSILNALESYPSCICFCGPVVTTLPEETPNWIRHNRFSHFVCSDFAPQLSEGPIEKAFFARRARMLGASPYIPVGSNIILRKPLIGEITFREQLGLSRDLVLFGEESDLLHRLRSHGDTIVFVPGAVVSKNVFAQDLALPILFEKGFQFGRIVVCMDNRPHIYPFHWLDYCETVPGTQFLEFGMLLNYYYGQLYQFVCEGKHVYGGILSDVIQTLCWSGDRALLSPTAEAWLNSNREYRPNVSKKRCSLP